ncbi:Alpha/Beta hydrolase protein [Aspergillus nidulans var. acristatus]
MYFLLSVVFHLSVFCAGFPPVVPREISTTLLTSLTLMSQYSAASGCSENNNSSFAGSSDLPRDTASYIAADYTNALLVISFRNSVTPTNFITDWAFLQVNTSAACSGFRAHKGFWSSAMAANKALDGAIRNAKARYPDTPEDRGVAVDFYTFGAPSVGDYAMADYITNGRGSDIGRNYRVTHLNGVFSKVLYRASRMPVADRLVQEYSQSGPEYWITSGFGEPVTTADVRILEGVDNERAIWEENLAV